MPSSSSPPTEDPRAGTLPLVIAPGELDRLIEILQRQGRTVIGPVVDEGIGDGTIVNDVIESADDLPWGLTDEQAPGRYRLRSRSTGEAFGFANPAQSFKRYLHPPRSRLFTAHRHRDPDETGVAVTIEPARPEPASLALFGIRSCDLAGLGLLDQALTRRPGDDGRTAAPNAGEAPSTLDAFIVAVSCGRPGATCFCASMDTGPTPGPGFDLALTELVDDRPHEFLVEAATDAGRAVANELRGRQAQADDQARAAAITERARSTMGRRLDPDDPPAAGRALDHPRWQEVGQRCLACANCTLVCPTCFCSATEDVTTLEAEPDPGNRPGSERTERHLVWDSCFGSSFSELNGNPVRSSTADRYRQWLLHKLVTWHDQFGTSGCVGCGRCITWCPVGIDLTEEVAALSRPPQEAAS